MKRLIGVVLAAVLVTGSGSQVRADEGKDAKAILDQAIKALGGEEKHGAAKAATWKSKGTINLGGNESKIETQTTVQGADHLRAEFKGDFNGMEVKGVTVLNGDKGWRKFGEDLQELDKDTVANEKRNAYLGLIPILILPVKEKGFKVEAAGEEKVGDKPAAVVKVTGPDGKDLKLYIDKESGLPVKQVAKAIGFMGDEYTQEMTFSNYKDFDGIKKATKVEMKRDGEKFIDLEVVEFKALDKVDPKTFDEPK
jgi:hypothetical protein